jgi:SPP1 gp7 family putative phage head morphogenesis protein
VALAPRPTYNDVLRDEGIAHAIQIERLKNSEQKAIVAFIEDDLLPDLIAKIDARLALIEERGLDIGPTTTSKLNRLIDLLKASVEAKLSGRSQHLFEQIGEIAQLEGKWGIAQLVDLTDGLPVTISTALPAIPQLQALVLARPIDGVLLEKLTDNLSVNTQNSIEKALRLGVASGETTAQIVSRVVKTTELVRDAATVIMRTAISQAASVARDVVYEENADLLRGIQWVSTLDTRTCPICAPLDGRLYKLGTGPRPPLHIQCRCSTCPVLKSWSELGFNARDIGATTRASMDGQVSGAITYGNWLRRRSLADQEDVLGVTRAKLFRSGKLDISDFANNSNELITLDTLRALYADAFARAGI